MVMNMNIRHKYLSTFSYPVIMMGLIFFSFVLQEGSSFKTDFDLLLIFILTALFLVFYLINILFLRLFKKISHEGFKRLSIIATVIGALVFLISFSRNLELMETRFYSEHYFSQAILLLNAGALLMLICVNIIIWVQEGFQQKTNNR